MIFTLNFKTSDVVDYAVEDLAEDEKERAREFLSRWIKYGEYVSIEFNDEDNSTIVCEVKR